MAADYIPRPDADFDSWHYMLRWVTATGLKGPWSETASVTIGAWMNVGASAAICGDS